MNEFVKQIYDQRCAAAEYAANELQQASGTVFLKFQLMSKRGVLYPRAERKRDSDAVDAAQRALTAALNAVLQMEEDDQQR